jgi:hypothetical protein
MRNLITTLLLILSINLTAQREFNGMWTSETSSYVTNIIASEYSVLKVVNISFFEENIISEDIISESNDSFKTTLLNKDNGYSVAISYELKDPNHIICTYIGDINRKVLLTRLKNKNDKF